MPKRNWQFLGVLALLGVAGIGMAAEAPDIIQEWASIKAPAPPMLKAVAIAPEKTALLLISFAKRGCSTAERARCPAAIPKLKRLLDGARARHMLVVHGFTANQMPGDMVPELAPAPASRSSVAPETNFSAPGLRSC
jgi:hypothetical protein